MTCTQPLLIHANRRVSCPDAECVVGLTLAGAVGRHRRLIRCADTSCSVCSDGRAAKPEEHCPGEVVIHVGNQFECPEPGCAFDLPLGPWLARHRSFRPCHGSYQPGTCPVCSERPIEDSETPERPFVGPQYVITLRGAAGSFVRDTFADLQVSVVGKVTLLRGVTPDQAGLYGVLLRLCQIGAEVLQVQKWDIDENDRWTGPVVR
jgi:hypothetical protein